MVAILIAFVHVVGLRDLIIIIIIFSVVVFRNKM
jgi:hypothetical protein